jgi:hypothetical protein
MAVVFGVRILLIYAWWLSYLISVGPGRMVAGWCGEWSICGWARDCFADGRVSLFGRRDGLRVMRLRGMALLGGGGDDYG